MDTVLVKKIPINMPNKSGSELFLYILAEFAFPLRNLVELVNL
jgi:hypothetical protein